MGRLQLGVSLNNRGAVYLSNYRARDMIRMAERAEELGFSSVWAGEGIIDSPMYDPFVTLGAVAANTTTIKIGAAVIRPQFRHPVMLALAWATLDQLSGGRTILTLGIGGGTPVGVAKEAEIAGIPVNKRGRALEEMVEILRKLWSGETVTYSGEIYRLNDVKIAYYPVQKPPPIWIAAGIWVPKVPEGQEDKVSATPGFTAKDQPKYVAPLDRVARLGDGWFTLMVTPSEFGEANRKLTELAKRYGRDPSKITRAVECRIRISDDRDKARREVEKMIQSYFNNNPVDPLTIERWSIYGTREDCVRKLEEYLEAGVEVVKLTMASPDQLGMLEEVGKSILPSF